jgi:sirohydrochlorin cobaltochelatase
MRALLLVAHGSRDATSNRIVVDLAAELASLVADQYHCVKPVFLEFAKPEPARGIADCVACGVSEIVVLPHFLAPGRHVTRDVPALVQAARAAHPQVDFKLLTHVGNASKLAEAIAAHARRAPSGDLPRLAANA